MNLKNGMAAAVAATLATAAYAQVFSSTAVPAGISDNSLTVVDLTVAGGPASISEMHVLMSITHTWDSDLDIVLVAPDSRYVQLATDAGGAGDNFVGTRFSQCGAAAAATGVAPFSGNYIPEGGDPGINWNGPALPAGGFVASLANFSGTSANGLWQLWVYDDAGGDVGTVDDFTLEFNGQFSANGPAAPTGSAPTATAAATPTPALSGLPVLLRLTVSPGGCPASTGIVARMDLSPIGGSATQALFDNGTNGDVTAGDGVYSYSYNVPGSTLEANYTIPFTITDAQSRSGTGNLALGVLAPAQWEEAFQGGGDAGDLPNTAVSVSGSGPLTSIGGSNETTTDVDLFVIDICQPANFLASTDNPTTTGDTQLWLFNMNGVGITHNDDMAGAVTALRSQLTSINTASLQAGRYILGISRYNRDALDSGGQLLWNACAGGGFTCETGPTGPGAANAVAGWTNNAGSTGAYKITLQGACFAGGSSNCVADVDDGTGTGNDDGAVTIDDLLYYLVAFEGGGVNADIDNGTGTGTTDGAVTIDDLLYFLVRFEAGC